MAWSAGDTPGAALPTGSPQCPREQMISVARGRSKMPCSQCSWSAKESLPVWVGCVQLGRCRCPERSQYCFCQCTAGGQRTGAATPWQAATPARTGHTERRGCGCAAWRSRAGWLHNRAPSGIAWCAQHREPLGGGAGGGGACLGGPCGKKMQFRCGSGAARPRAKKKPTATTAGTRGPAFGDSSHAGAGTGQLCLRPH